MTYTVSSGTLNSSIPYHINCMYACVCKARRGEFVGCLSAGILPSLIDAGFVFVLRWALDDSSADNNSLSAAVSALHATVVCTDDEVSTDDVLSSSAYSNCVLNLEIPSVI